VTARRRLWPLGLGLGAVVLYGALVAVCALGIAIEQRTLASLFKPLPVLLLAGLVAARGSEAWERRTVMALLFCALGDVVLELGFFVPGLVAFLVGHLFFLGAFVGAGRGLHLERAVPFALWGGAAMLALGASLGPMKIPVLLYTATICAMMWRAACLLEAPLLAAERRWALSIAVGAIVFAASDTLIALNRFHTPFVGARPLILGLYWLGQLLLADGIVARAMALDSRPRSVSA
jgi:alkenylglycerophosphocholine/alkenylglycerophosphoethanolamine hydrolase